MSKQKLIAEVVAEDLGAKAGGEATLVFENGRSKTYQIKGIIRTGSLDLDTRTTQDIMELFRKLNEEKHQTIIMVTHNPELGAKADRIIHFRDGKVVEE